jgi:hypothetical protein
MSVREGLPMDNKKFMQWCDSATVWIRFGPDRKKVSKELLDHLENHRDAFIAQGMTEQEATDKALECMGSPKDISVQLASIHRPFWGYLLRYSRIAVVILLCLCLLTVGNYTESLYLKDSPTLQKFEIYSAESYGGDTGRTLHHLSQPNVSLHISGNRFTITDAALFTQPTTNDEEMTILYLRVRQTGWRPYQVQKEYYPQNGYNSPLSKFTAVDSLGNKYTHFFDLSNDPAMISYAVQTGIFTATGDLWIRYFPTDAEWVDICYTLDGHNLSMRVYL